MKIIHIIYDSINNPWLNGGGAMRTHELYKRIPKDISVEVFTGNYPHAKNTLDSVQYKRLGLPNNYIISRVSFFITAFFHVLFSDADVYIEDISPPMPLLITRYKKRYYASIQFLPTEIYRKKRKFFGSLYVFTFRRLLGFYKNIITVSQDTAESLRKINPGATIHVIPNGVDPVPDSHSSYSGKYLLYLGRIDIYEKGIDTLLHSLSILMKKGIIAQLILAGNSSGESRSKLQQLIRQYDLEKQVSYIGFTHGAKKNKLLKDAMCVVIPSRIETFGITVLEAFSHSKPVIASSAGGMKELLRKSEAGLTFRPGDYTALAENIETVISNKSLRQILGQRGKEFAELYSWEKISTDYRKIMYV